MKRIMKEYLLEAAALAVWLITLAGCSGSEVIQEEGSGQQESVTQQFTVVVESVGELFSQADSRRPISSVDPEQSFDKLSLIITRYESPAEVVYMKTLDGWSDTHNRVSVPWSQGDSRGRKAVVTLTGDECLENGRDYLVYAVGYQSGTYGGYEAFAGVKPGDNFFRTEIADVPEGGIAEEIFAGAESFHVHDGKIYPVASSEAEEEEAVVVLRRQVAGTFGYLPAYRLSMRASQWPLCSWLLPARTGLSSLVDSGEWMMKKISGKRMSSTG